METALKDAKSFQGSEQLGIHKVFPEKQRPPCKHCGRKNHDAERCYHRSAKCHTCGVMGHIAPICKAPRKASQGPRGKIRPHARNSEAEHYLTPHCDDADDEDSPQEVLGMFNVHQISGTSPTPIIVSLEVEGKQIPMEVDTGAGVSIIPLLTWKAHFPDLPHSKNEGMKHIPAQYDSHTFSFHTIGMKEAFILL